MFNKNNPSDEFLEKIKIYKKIHKEGQLLINGSKKLPENTYDGKSTIGLAKIIKNIIQQNNFKSLLDYGCGKAYYYFNEFIIHNERITSLQDYWNVNINLYEPCIEKFSDLPKSVSDLSICIDVLEHIPESDIDWVLEEISNYTSELMFLCIANFKAKALLTNGENAHINIHDSKWWFYKLLDVKKKFPKIKILALISSENNDGKRDYFPINIDDNMNNYLK
tara:strand:+ start:46 stop:711 length:666 start_codon:yes stop_codon:yes gene_type:complete